MFKKFVALVLIACCVALSSTAQSQFVGKTEIPTWLGEVKVDSLLWLKTTDTVNYAASLYPGAIVFRQQPGDTSHYHSNGVKWQKLGKEPDLTAYMKYTDSAAMLSPYLRKADTTGKWIPAGATLANIYNSDGTLTGPRTLEGTGNGLSLNNTPVTISEKLDVGGGSNGRIQLNKGTTTVTGWAAFYTPGGSLLGWLGNSQTNMYYRAQGAAIHEFFGRATVNAADDGSSTLQVGGTGRFTGTVQGANATAANHFVTRQQVTDSLNNRPAPVQSVNGYTGNVTLTKSDVGLASADNTSDANKPVSTAQQAALDLKEDVANKSTSTSLGASNTLYPTQNAVKTYVDGVAAALAPSSGSANYIQNQFDAPQSGNGWLSGQFRVGGLPGSGFVHLNTAVGAAGWTGYYLSSGVRLGYIGGDATNMNYVAENGANHVFSGGVAVGNSGFQTPLTYTVTADGTDGVAGRFIQYNAAQNRGMNLQLTGGATPGMAFWLTNSGGGWEERMRINGTDGNVGINTTTPTAKFEVNHGTTKYSVPLSATDTILTSNLQRGGPGNPYTPNLSLTKTRFVVDAQFVLGSVGGGPLSQNSVNGNLNVSGNFQSAGVTTTAGLVTNNRNTGAATSVSVLTGDYSITIPDAGQGPVGVSLPGSPINGRVYVIINQNSAPAFVNDNLGGTVKNMTSGMALTVLYSGAWYPISYTTLAP
ncbi:hypothetical protein EGT74_24570 [Chitinophaga lutea]|uniref:Tail fiber protein n=1 Tax=Chitinophaga lutea TaxID=2488634 RepID=A0A3N4PL29_9BACT|nr:hypothetical protein [Chitinophaga lutea]RPE05561.1 hypothetical protein EGT74_24570 [Chitinophaga lutea]